MRRGGRGRTHRPNSSGRGETPATPVDAIFNASRHVVLPGLVNTHHHFYQTLTRAHPAGLNKDLLPWLVALERVWARMKPEQLRIAVRLALVELMLSGCTTAADHHNLFPAGLENAIDIEVEAARELGLRMTVTRGSMGLSEKDGGLQPDGIVQDADTILARQRARAQAVSRSRVRARKSRSLWRPARRSRCRGACWSNRRAWPNGTIAGCIRISASRRTKTSTPRRLSASARSTYSKRLAG